MHKAEGWEQESLAVLLESFPLQLNKNRKQIGIHSLVFLYYYFFNEVFPFQGTLPFYS